MNRFIVTLCLGLLLVLMLPATAGAATLAERVAALESKVSTLKTTVTGQGAKITALQVLTAQQKTQIAALQTTVAAQGTKLTAAAPVLALAPYVSLTSSALNGVKGPNIVFKGVNVTVRSRNAEDDVTGTGNLIVGWDDLPPYTLPSPWRIGSNNLVVGSGNNFTSYGCFVAGSYNTTSEALASVSGGTENKASGICASVSGGWTNTASGNYASVSGGRNLIESIMYGWMGGAYHTP